MGGARQRPINPPQSRCSTHAPTGPGAFSDMQSDGLIVVPYARGTIGTRTVASLSRSPVLADAKVHAALPFSTTHPPSMADRVKDQFFAECCAMAAGKAHAKSILKVLASAGITNCSDLRSMHSTFRTLGVTPDDTELTNLDVAIRAHVAANPGAGNWPPNPAAGKAALCKIIIRSTELMVAEATATGTALASEAALLSGSSAALTSAQRAELDKLKAKSLFETFEEAHGIMIEAAKRGKYEIIAKTHKAFTSNTPVSFALGEYCLNLQAQATEMVEYEAFGKTFYSARDGETASKQAKLASFDEMFACMALRSQARAVAGSFDIILNATDKGVPPPTARQKLAESVVKYASTDVSGADIVRKLDAFATPSVMDRETAAMRDFHLKHPHVSITNCINVIDAGVEREINNLTLRGWTMDAAVDYVVSTQPHLYSLQKVESTDSPAGGSDKTSDKSKVKKTDEQKSDSQTRLLEQQKQQIANLKRKLGAGAATPPRGNGTKGAGGSGTPLAGKQKVPCAPDICQNFNFKSAGCTLASCNYKHVCCLCGQAHPFKGNH